jgi:hypothetical protein
MGAILEVEVFLRVEPSGLAGGFAESRMNATLLRSGISIGRSAGLAPCKILWTKFAVR